MTRMAALLPRRARPALALVAGAWGCNPAGDACISLAEPEVVLVAYLADDGARPRVEVEVRRASHSEGDIPLRLCDESAIVVDGVEAAGVRRPSGATVYRASTGKIGADPVEHTFRLLHEDGEDEYTAVVDAPAFAITAPKKGARLSRAAAWDLAWEPAREGATIAARVADVIDGESCLGAPIELELPDSGAAQIAAGEVVVAKEGYATVDECEAFVTLARRITTPLEPVGGDSRLHPDSRLEATTSRERTFTSIP